MNKVINKGDYDSCDACDLQTDFQDTLNLLINQTINKIITDEYGAPELTIKTEDYEISIDHSYGDGGWDITIAKIGENK
jgi:hypothetical protein